jgi:HrpA-like RNA helicase
LVFLPGMQEITKLYRFIVTDKYIGQRSTKFTIIPLHSSLSSIMQHKVFDRPPEGVRKIVLATNIAETSITIDDVTYVIDSGKVYKNTNLLTSLEDERDAI